jgi:excisionase family DNA binding protein
MTDQPRLLTARQLAAYLQVAEATVFRWAAAGRIPCVRLAPKALRFDLPEVMRAVGTERK